MMNPVLSFFVCGTRSPEYVLVYVEHIMVYEF